MNRKALRKVWRRHSRTVMISLVGLAALAWLLLHRLGLLTNGVSTSEMQVAHSSVGWHGLYDHSLYFPLEVVRSAVYYLFSQHGAFLIRLPSAFFGGLAVIAMTLLIKLWHGNRTALFGSVLFACSAWTLHVSRLAGSQSVYLLAVPALLLLHTIFQRYVGHKLVILAICLCWSMLLTIPGLIWLVLWSLIWQRTVYIDAWHTLSKWWQKLLALLLSLIWLPLIGLDFWHHHNDIWTWLGAPVHWNSPLVLLKSWGQVFIHLFIYAPKQPELWLGRLPILDVFTLVCCILGLYFYIWKFAAYRSRILGGYLIIGSLLVAIGGPVGISILVPLLYVLTATGITYLLHEWLAVFPINPIARGVGIGVLGLAVAAASLYNLQAYFVAWPHNTETKTTFNHHL